MHTSRVCHTKIYISEYKFNNMEDVNTVFFKSNFWRHPSWSGRVSILFVIAGGVESQKCTVDISDIAQTERCING